MVLAACSLVVMRIVPPGLSRSSLRLARAVSMSSKFGVSVWNSRSPASVGATLRVVRVSRRSPQPGFEAADGMAERRLRHAELGRGAGEAAFARHGEEGLQIVVVLAGHAPIAY
jgi:hypothetical protein